MNKVVLACVLLASVACAQSIDEFRGWAVRHGKRYTKSEEARRYLVFKENAAVAARLNLEGHGASFGTNKFSDLTNAEFAARYTTKLTYPGENKHPELPMRDGRADGVDYRSWLPAVKNQGQCGSCWAFSAVANMEGQYYKNKSAVISLSEQQLVSCDLVMNMGCNGGNPLFADYYAIEKGMATEEKYPYTSGTGVVAKCSAYEPVAFFTSAQQFLALKDDTLIEHLLQYGPLTVAIEADKPVFQSYTGGVLDSAECGTALNHGVTLVGYGTDAETQKPYWLVRNSWGADWGVEGHIKLVRGKDMCGINSRPSTIVA